MGKAGRNKELAFALPVQFYRKPFAEHFGAAAQVHNYVLHTTFNDGNQFALGRNLVMQAAQDSFAAEGDVILNKVSLDAYFTVSLLVPGFQKVSACIAEYFGFNNKKTFKICRNDVHFFVF